MAPRTLTVGTCGPEHARRYFIVDQDHNFWNEKDQTWTANPREAGLFADQAEVAATLHDLMVTQVPGILQRFIVPVVVEVKGTEPITVEALAEWLDTAVEILPSDPHGTGPGGAMVMMRMDVPQLEETSDETD
jgi:hypothetical protein